MGAQQGKPDRLAGRLFEKFMYQQHVADGLGHFLPVDIDEPVMQPVAHERIAAMGAGGLRNFVFVMGEDQIDAAPMDIDRPAQVLFDHA